MKFAVFLTPIRFTSRMAVSTRAEEPTGVKVAMTPAMATTHLVTFHVVDRNPGSITMGKVLAEENPTSWTILLPTTLQAVGTSLPSQGTEMTLSSVTAMEAYVESDEVAAVVS